MKAALLYLTALFVGTMLLISGAQSMTGYYAEPSGYGFYHVWSAYLHLSIAITVMGSAAMVYVVRRIGRRLF
jgi:hypothetical protein